MNARHPTLLLATSLLLSACQQETVREIDWAKAALARNPHYEVVATRRSRLRPGVNLAHQREPVATNGRLHSWSLPRTLISRSADSARQ